MSEQKTLKQMDQKPEEKRKRMKAKAYKVGKVSWFSSIRTKILFLVLSGIVLTAIIFLWTIIPVTQDNLSEFTASYMKDVVKAYGNLLDRAVEVNEEALEAEAIKNLVGDISINNVSSSYAYVVDRDGIMLYHPTPDKIGQPVENVVVTGLVADLKKGIVAEPDATSYEFNGTVKYASYYIGTDSKYILVISADEADIFSFLDYIIKRTIEAGGFSLIVFGLIGLFVVELTVRPINRITTIVAKLAEMDFTHNEFQDKLDKRRDETGSMSRAISALREQLRNVVSGIKTQSMEIYKSSEDLNVNARNTAGTMEEVERTVLEIADGATSQAQETQKATENVILMGNMVEETNEEVANLRDNANVIRESSDNASEILKDLGEINGKTKEAIEVIYEQTNTTNESAVKIREATAIITSIAEETNLLSLNATIEAARAGEQGRGFAVVASQIQKLAEQSDESARQIENIVNSLISDSEKAVETMNVVKEIIEKQSDNVVKTNTIFGQVKDGLDHSISGIAAIADKTKKLDEARVNVVDVVQNLTAIAEENAASTEETSASVSEVTNIVSNISGNSQQLKSVSDKLEEHMGIFRL